MPAKQDIFDRVYTDIFDRIELPVEQKVVFSKDMEKLVREILREEIRQLPVGKIITRVLEKEVLANKESAKSTEAKLDQNIEKSNSAMQTELETIKKEMTDFKEKMRKKHDDFRNLFGAEAQPWYQFGGFPPPGQGIPIPGDGGLTEWRLIIVNHELEVQYLNANVWVTKATFLRSA